MPPKINYRKPVYGNRKKAEAKADETVAKAESKVNYIPELEILDFQGHRNAKLFNNAKKSLETYVSKNYDPKNAHIFKFNENFQFPELEDVDEESLLPENDPHGFNKDMRKMILKERFHDEKKFRENEKKIYAILWGQCTNSMQHRIEMEEDFVEYDADHNLGRLWNRIGQLLLTAAGDGQNLTLLRVKTMSEFDKFRQGRNESVGDFYHRFNNELVSLEASDIEIPAQPHLAMQFLTKLDLVRFAPLLAELENAATRGQDLYPGTVNEAMIRAQNYKVVLPRYDPNGNSTGIVFNVTTAENSRQEKKRKVMKKTKNKKNQKIKKKMQKIKILMNKTTKKRIFQILGILNVGSVEKMDTIRPVVQIFSKQKM